MTALMIWIISDNPEIRQYLQTILKHANYHVTTFMKSLDAIECIQAYPALVPHLVCVHPSSDEDGYSVSEQLRMCSMTMRIVLFSPFPTHCLEIIKAQRTGIDRLLAIPTPYDIHTIIPPITTLLLAKSSPRR